MSMGLFGQNEMGLIETYVILEKSKKPYISLLYDFGNIKVWSVDAKWVKELPAGDPDFTEGGNNGKYPFIPRDEIWIDDRMGKEMAVTALHEMNERYDILLGGLDYDKAHDRALAIEMSIRKTPGADARAEAEMKRLAEKEQGIEKAISVKGYTRTRHGKLERVKPSIREALYVHTEMPVGHDITPAVLTAIGPSGKKYVVENVRLYPTSRQPLTYGNLVELQKTSPSTRVTVKMHGQDSQIEVRWLALPDLPEKSVKLEQVYPPKLPEGTPNPGQYVLFQGTWARVERVYGDPQGSYLVVKKIYDAINECPKGVSPDAEYHLTLPEAIEAKRLKDRWEGFYQKFFESAPVAEPVDELERSVLKIENEALRHKHDKEMAYVFDYDGNLKITKDGVKEHVFFNTKEIPKLYGTIITHNHPHGGSFSENDVFRAYKWGLSELRVVTEKFVYTMQPPEGEGVFNPALSEQIRTTYWTAEEEVLDHFLRLKDEGKVNATDMQDIGFDSIMVKFARKTGIKYERSRWPDAKPREEGEPIN